MSFQDEIRKRNLLRKGATTSGFLQKARSGVYADTGENRGKNRVGQKYGAPKKEEEPATPKPKKSEESSEKKSTAPQGESTVGTAEVAQLTHMKSIIDSDPIKASEIFAGLSPEAQAIVPQDVANKLFAEAAKDPEDSTPKYDDLEKKPEAKEKKPEAKEKKPEAKEKKEERLKQEFIEVNGRVGKMFVDNFDMDYRDDFEDFLVENFYLRREKDEKKVVSLFKEYISDGGALGRASEERGEEEGDFVDQEAQDKLEKLAGGESFEGSDDEIFKLVEVAREEGIEDSDIKDFIGDFFGDTTEDDFDYWLGKD